MSAQIIRWLAALTPQRTRRAVNIMSKIGIGIAAAALLVGLWFGGWAVYRANLAQQNDANHTSQQWQDATIAAERNRVQGWAAATDKAQKKQIAATFCAIYPTITNPPADLAAANARIC